MVVGWPFSTRGQMALKDERPQNVLSEAVHTSEAFCDHIRASVFFCHSEVGAVKAEIEHRSKVCESNVLKLIFIGVPFISQHAKNLFVYRRAENNTV